MSQTIITTTTGERLINLCAGGNSLTKLDEGQWLLIFPGLNVLTLHDSELDDTLPAITGRAHREDLHAETEDGTLLYYPAGQWPVVSVERSN